MDYKTLFVDSLLLHQKFVDILAEARDENGVSAISPIEIAERIERSQTWISSAIKRLNTEDICIEIVSCERYKLHYDNLKEQGVFCKIIRMIEDTVADPSIFSKKDSVLAEEYAVKLKTIQMYKAYLRTGCKVSGKDS